METGDLSLFVWCGGWDSNPRTPKGLEPQSNAVGHAGRPPHARRLDSHTSKTLPSGLRWSRTVLQLHLVELGAVYILKAPQNERMGRAGVAQPGRAHPLGLNRLVSEGSWVQFPPPALNSSSDFDIAEANLQRRLPFRPRRELPSDCRRRGVGRTKLLITKIWIRLCEIGGLFGQRQETWRAGGFYHKGF